MTDQPALRVSAAEFLARSETNRLMQLIEGEIIDMGSPSPDHQVTVYRTARTVEELVAALDGNFFIAPLDVELDDGTVVQPDVMAVLPNSKCIIAENRLIGAPDLVIEVLSPGTAQIDRGRKFHLYERHGVREYWMIDLANALVDVWMLKDGRFVLLDVYGRGETFHSPLLGAVVVDRLLGRKLG
ncbi:MAG: Uma2 family endonuclease [Chloroflexota bacterium]|nr:Uma2 family endonuclease [Chloroflexota bacterium]